MCIRLDFFLSRCVELRVEKVHCWTASRTILSLMHELRTERDASHTIVNEASGCLSCCVTRLYSSMATTMPRIKPDTTDGPTPCDYLERMHTYNKKGQSLNGFLSEIMHREGEKLLIRYKRSRRLVLLLRGAISENLGMTLQCEERRRN